MKIWFVYAVLCAIFLSLSDVFSKKFSSQLGEIEIAFGRAFFALPALWLFVYTEGIPFIDKKILLTYALGIPLETVAIILYMKAISISPLSVTVPFLSFTPAFC